MSPINLRQRSIRSITTPRLVLLQGCVITAAVIAIIAWAAAYGPIVIGG